MRKPQILVNALSLSEGGGRNYVEHLLREISRDDRGMDFTFLCLRGALQGLDTRGVGIETLKLPSRPRRVRTPLRALYEQTGLPWRARRFDLLYCLADTSPAVASTPTVVLLRNLNIYDRRFYDDRRTRTLAQLARWGARRASRIVFPSQAAADQIGALTPLPSDRVRVVHHGIDPAPFRTAQPLEAERPYLLLPAALERHKNVEVLIRALALCRDETLELWLANPATIDPAHADQLWALGERTGVRGRIRQLGSVPHAELGRYYRGARGLAFPSLLETFGHPVLEAMAAGTPLMLSDIATFREIAGDAAVYFDPHDPEGLARCIDGVTDSPEATRERVERGLRRVDEFSWSASVDALCGVFEEVLEESRAEARPVAAGTKTRNQRLLVVNNSPFEQSSGGVYVEGPTGRFLRELGTLSGGIRAAQGLASFETRATPDGWDASACPDLEVAALPWPLAGRIRRVVSYLRAIPWILQQVRRASGLYVFLPGHLPLLFAMAARLLGRPYGCYLRGELREPWLGLALKPARFALAANEEMQRQARRHCPSCHLVAPMIEIGERDLVAPRAPRAAGPWRILFVGRVEEAKGVAELREAVALLQARGLPIELDLVGWLPSDSKGTRWPPNVRFHGVVSDRGALRDLYAAADLFVLPSHSEGFPRVLYEAMAFGVPALTTFVGGVPSLMEDGVNCLRVPVRDADALARTLERAIGDPELRLRIARGASDTMRRVVASDRPSHARLVHELTAAQGWGHRPLGSSGGSPKTPLHTV